MKLRSLINFGEALNVVAGINFHLHEDGRPDISFAVLKREKDLVSQVKIVSGISTPEALIQALAPVLPKYSRIHINIEGRGILLKTLQKNEAVQDQREVIKRSFPMVKEEEFVSQLYTGSDTSFFQIARKDIFSSLIQCCTDYSLVSFSLGVFITAPILPLLKERVLSLKGYTITQEGDKITRVDIQQTVALSPFVIDKEFVPAESLLAYASAWYLLLGHPDLEVSGLPWVEEAQNRYNFQTHVYKATKWALIAMLTILIINTGIYFWLQSKTEVLAMQESLFSDRSKKNNLRQKQTQRLTAAYEKIGWPSNRQPLYYADQLAKLTHEDVQLTSLELGVLDEAVLKKEKQYIYKSNLVKIKGVTESPLSLQEMIKAIENCSWVKEIVDQRYQHDARRNKGVFEFYIYLK